jgi:prepilin-type N-terminal cleavage/methylation domain-containing protein
MTITEFGKNIGGREATHRRSLRRKRNWKARDEGANGFTLVELVIVITVMPVVIGAISLGLISIFSLQSGVSGRLTDTGDAQVTSSTFLKDVQSSTWLTTSSTAECGSGIQLLGLAWDGSASANAQSIVSYVAVANAGSSSYSLYRQICTSGASATPSGTVTIATDVSPNEVSPPLPLVINCVSSHSDCATTAASSWASTVNVTSVQLTVTETRSLIAGSGLPFTFVLTATPRLLGEGNPSPPPIPPFAPFTLLNNSACNGTNVLSIGNGTLSINVGTGTGNGTLGLTSTCPNAVSVANSGQLDASGGIVTADPTLNSCTSGPTGSCPPSEYYSNQVTDPFAAMVAPSDPPNPSLTKQTGCTVSPTQSNTYICAPGEYDADPGASISSGSTIDFYPGGTFWFKGGLTIRDGSNGGGNPTVASFSSGTYIFDAPNTQSKCGSVTDYYAFCFGINDQITGTGVLFYIKSGAATFLNNSSISLLPYPQGTPFYQGVTIWDAAATDSPTQGAEPLTLGNNGTGGYGYGGIYVPKGEVSDSNNGTLTCSFIIADTASFSNGLNVNIIPSTT